MTPSKLQPCGTCYQCGEPVAESLRFCGDNCRNRYYYNENRRAMNKGKRKAALDARIEKIVQRAIRNGTCYTVAAQAPQQ